MTRQNGCLSGPFPITEECKKALPIQEMWRWDVMLAKKIGLGWVAPRDLSLCWASTLNLFFVSGEWGALDAFGDLEVREQFSASQSGGHHLRWLFGEATKLSRSGYHLLDIIQGSLHPTTGLCTLDGATCESLFRDPFWFVEFSFPLLFFSPFLVCRKRGSNPGPSACEADATSFMPSPRCWAKTLFEYFYYILSGTSVFFTTPAIWKKTEQNYIFVSKAI